MNKYEMTIVVRTDIDEKEIKKTADDMKKVLVDAKAKIPEEKDLGAKELAYEINKMKTGHYFFYTVETNSKTVDEFDRLARINENIIRHLTIRVDD